MTADLSLVATDDLVEALFGRFDHATFSGMRERVGPDGSHVYIRRWMGNSHTVIGLAAHTTANVIRAMDDEHGELGPDDERRL